MWDSLPDYERQISDYQLYIPEAIMLKHKYAGIILLVREGIDLKIHNEMMHEDIAAIWIGIQYSARKRMRSGGVYRACAPLQTQTKSYSLRCCTAGKMECVS